MPTVEDRLVALERQVRIALATTSALQGQPADATLSIPHNDSFPFEDNVDATHPANLRYIISKNVTRVVSARLSIFMAPYRTYNSFTVATTGGASVRHSHGSESGHSHSHAHSLSIAALGSSPSVHVGFNGSVPPLQHDGTGTITDSSSVNGNAAGSSNHLHGSDSPDHSHSITGSSLLGVTEGTVATGVTVSFDGVDATVALGGPFNADVLELDVRRFIQTAIGVKHTIAMSPSGNGRIEAFLRLGVYVSAAQGL
jgi:hypothetical protein